jgi:hypothetical protein
MTAHLPTTAAAAEALAEEASRYLAVVDAFAGLGADPHAVARARAARTRRAENQPAQTAGKGGRRWTR